MSERTSQSNNETPGEPPDVNADAAEVLARVSRKILEAIGRKNAEVLDAILDDAFVHLSSDNQRQTKQEFVSGVTEATYTVDEIGFDSLRVECGVEVGVAAGIQRARGHLSDGTEFVSVGAFTDVFRRTEAGWRLWLAHSVELPRN